MVKTSKWLLAASAGLLLAACGPGESTTEESVADTGNESDERQTLLVWEDIEKSNGIEEAIAAFEEEYNVDVEVVEKAYASQIEDLRLDGPGGTGPDVLTMPGDQIGTAVVEGLLAPLSTTEEVQGIYTDVAMNSQKVDGTVYGLPKAVETTILYYNKEIISEEELPTTLEGWYDLSKELTNGDNYGLLALWDQIYYAQSLISGYGGYIFGQDADGNYDTTDLGLNNDGAVEAVEYISTWYEEGLFPSGMIGEQAINVLDSLFAEGKAAAVISGPWNLGPYSDAGIDYGVVSFPTLPNGNPMSAFVGVKSYNVSSYSKNKELAQAFVEFITNEENSLKRYEITKEVPAVTVLAENETIAQDPAAQAVAEQSQNSELTPSIPEMAEVWLPVDSALQTVATKQQTAKEALDTAVQTIKDQIQANHGGN